MRYYQYRYKFLLNARHAVYMRNQQLGEAHPHTWEIVLDVIRVMEVSSQSDYVEKAVEEFIGQYRNQTLNEKEPFITLEPTLENIGEYFMKRIRELLADRGWLLLKIELREADNASASQAHSYVVDLLESVEALTEKEAEAAGEEGAGADGEEGVKADGEEGTEDQSPQETEKNIDSLANAWIDQVLAAEKDI